MMVRSVNENVLDRRFAKGFGRSQTTKTAADDHYPQCLRRLLIRTIDRIQVSIVHLFIPQAFDSRHFRESPATADYADIADTKVDRPLRRAMPKYSPESFWGSLTQLSGYSRYSRNPRFRLAPRTRRPYQASQRLIRRMTRRVVKPSHGIKTTSTLT